MKKLFKTTLMSTLTLCSVTSCQGNSNTEFEIWHHYAGTNRTEFESLVDEFNNTIEGYSFKAVNKGRVSTSLTQLKANMATSQKDMPVLWLGMHDYVTELYNDVEMKEFLVDMEPLRDDYDNTYSINFELMEAGNSYGNDARYAIPHYGKTEFLYVNTDLFKETFLSNEEFDKNDTVNSIEDSIENGTAITKATLNELRLLKDDVADEYHMLQYEFASYFTNQGLKQMNSDYFDKNSLKSNFKNNQELKDIIINAVDNLNIKRHSDIDIGINFASDFFGTGNVLFGQFDQLAMDYISKDNVKNYKMLPVVQMNNQITRSIAQGYSYTMFDEGYEKNILQSAYDFINTSLSKNNHQKFVDNGSLSMRNDVAAESDPHGFHKVSKDIELFFEDMIQLTDDESHRYSTDIRTSMGSILTRYSDKENDIKCSKKNSNENIYQCIADSEYEKFISKDI